MEKIDFWRVLWVRGFSLILIVLLSGCVFFATVSGVKKILNREISTYE